MTKKRKPVAPMGKPVKIEPWFYTFDPSIRPGSMVAFTIPSIINGVRTEVRTRPEPHPKAAHV